MIKKIRLSHVKDGRCYLVLLLFIVLLAAVLRATSDLTLQLVFELFFTGGLVEL
jgi:hypothetical protein